MDEETRRSLCRVIAGIVIADERVDRREERFLNRLLKKFGLDVEAKECLYPIMDAKGAAEELRGMNWAVQEEALKLLVEAAVVDREYCKEERAYLHAVAEVIGVSIDEIDGLVDRFLG